VMSIVTRLFSGKASDRYGRETLLLIGTFSLTLSTLILAVTNSQASFFLGGIVFGISTGINSPTLFAWTVDLANPEKRGKAIATMFIALEIGILLGAVISAEIYANQSERFSYAFGSGTILALSAFLYLWRRRTKRKSTI